MYGFSADISLAGILLLRNLIDLIDKDNSLFRLIYVVVRSCKEL